MVEAAPDSRRRGGGHIGWFVLLLAAALATGGLAWATRAELRRLGAEVAAMDARLAAQADTLQLYRFEQRSKAGLGMDALVEQLLFWGQQVNLATTPGAERQAIIEHLTNIMAAMRALPAGEVMARLQQEVRGADPVQGAEAREWLLRAVGELGGPDAPALLEAAARGLEWEISNRNRLTAVKWLAELDAPRAAAVLYDVVRTESHRGIEWRRVPPAVASRFPNAAAHFRPNPGFFNFVALFAESGHPDVDNTLIMLLGRKHEHDVLTLQECVKALGARRVAAAVEPIKELFEEPPIASHPMFRNHCLDALAEIQGAAARDYFKAALRDEPLEIVQAKLTDLLKRTDG